LNPKSLSRLQHTNALRSDLLDELERHAELLLRFTQELERHYLHVEAATLTHAAIARHIGAWTEPLIASEPTPD
jgi:hypothetical protein